MSPNKGKKPQPQRKAKSVGRMDEALWKRARAHAAKQGRLFYSWLEEAIREKLKREEGK